MLRQSMVLGAALLSAAHPLSAQRPGYQVGGVQRPTHPAGAILRKVPLHGHPYGVAITRGGDVYVSKVNTSELARLTFAPGDTAQVTTIGAEPPHLVVEQDGRTVFATLQRGKAVVRYDTRTGRTTDSVALGGDGFNLALDPDGRHLVATAAHGWAYRITRRPLAIVDSLFVGAVPNGVVFDRSGGRVYVTSRDAGVVTAIDAGRFRAVRRWYLGGALQRIAISPDGRTLFVTDEGSGSGGVRLDSMGTPLLSEEEAPTGGVIRIDVATGTFQRTPMAGTPYGIGVTPDGLQLWVLLLDEGTVEVYDPRNMGHRRTIAVGGRPRNLAFTHRGDHAVVTNGLDAVLLR